MSANIFGSVASLTLFCVLTACAASNPDGRNQTADPAMSSDNAASDEPVLSRVSDIQGSYMRCGAQVIRIHPQQKVLLVLIGDWYAKMLPVPSASGAQFIATNNHATKFWSKGKQALLTLDGKALPECRAVPTADEPSYFAQGNQPDWTLSNGPAYVTFRPSSGRIVNLPMPVVDLSNGKQIFVAVHKDETLTTIVSPGPCRDDSSGISYPDKVEVKSGDSTWRGCGGTPADLLLGPPWVVEDIGGRGIIDNSHVTLSFEVDGRSGGKGSCNTYGTDYTTDGDMINFKHPLSTMMACAEALMAQEHAYFDLLPQISQFDIGDDGSLTLSTEDGRTITARR